MKILIVDDNEDSRMILQKTLEHGSHTVKSATNGVEALQVAEGASPDMIISDILMPEMDGFRLCREVKQIDQLKKIPFILYSSAYIGAKDELLAVNLGASRFIPKPIEADDFLNIIHGVFQEYREERLPVPEKPVQEEPELSRMYKESIVSKLDEKVQELKLYRQIFEQNEDAIMIFNHETSRIIDVNPAAVTLYGYSKEEFIGQGLSLFTGPDEYPRLKKGIFCKNEDNEIFLTKVLNIQKGGKTVYTSVRGKIIRLQEKDVVYCTFRDITEKMQAEEKTRNIQAKLIHANKMSSLGTLASGIAHEINNPNNFIMFNSQLLLDAWKDTVQILEEHYRKNGEFTLGGLSFTEMRGAVPKLLFGITDGSQRIKNIVDNLKDFARPDKPDLNGNIDVNKVITASTSILNNLIRKYTNNFHVHCGKDIPMVKGSTQQIEQVVINLIINSLQALPDREHPIWISSFADHESSCVAIEVKDEGKGMSKEVLARITEPFFTTKLDHGGTGLGLSISYSIINEHKGTLEFESDPGKGTRALIKLPVN